MGLPIWRDPDEAKVKKEQVKPDPTAAARSPIRRPRRPPYARSWNLPHPDTTRSFHPPSRSPPPNAARVARRAENRGVPPVSTLLESARTSTTTDPTDVTRDRFGSRYSHDRLHLLRAEIDGLNNTAAQQGNGSRESSEPEAMPEGYNEWSSDVQITYLRGRAAELQREAEGHQHRSVRLRREAEVSRARARAYLGDERRQRRSALPTPPDDESQARTSHRLSIDSPINGLGDRIRSPTPGDGWEIMRSTIAPDTTLPSADSSFASAAASHSFASSGTDLTEPDFSTASMDGAPRPRRRSESVSSLESDDLNCNDEEEREREAEFAAALYARERRTAIGRNRIQQNRTEYEREGRLYAMPDEPEPVEIGFRLIASALDSPGGRERIDRMARSIQHSPPRLRRLRTTHPTRTGHMMDDEPPTPDPARVGDNALASMREAADQVHVFFGRYSADSLTSARARNRSGSPPPRYEPLGSHPEVNAFVSRDPPTAHPVSPPSTRSERDISDGLLSGNETDLEPMRRIVERLAQREDVPEEWWMSMGLNISRDRARSRSPVRRHSRERAEPLTATGRVRSGRVDRGTSRL